MMFPFRCQKQRVSMKLHYTDSAQILELCGKTIVASIDKSSPCGGNFTKSTMKGDPPDTQQDMLEGKNFLEGMDEECAAKETEWDEQCKIRTEELLGGGGTCTSASSQTASAQTVREWAVDMDISAADTDQIRSCSSQNSDFASKVVGCSNLNLKLEKKHFSRILSRVQQFGRWIGQVTAMRSGRISRSGKSCCKLVTIYCRRCCQRQDVRRRATTVRKLFLCLWPRIAFHLCRVPCHILMEKLPSCG